MFETIFASRKARRIKVNQGFVSIYHCSSAAPAFSSTGRGVKGGLFAREKTQKYIFGSLRFPLYEKPTYTVNYGLGPTGTPHPAKIVKGGQSYTLYNFPFCS